jgi:hypothetical protein
MHCKNKDWHDHCLLVQGSPGLWEDQLLPFLCLTPLNTQALWHLPLMSTGHVCLPGEKSLEGRDHHTVVLFEAQPAHR